MEGIASWSERAGTCVYCQKVRLFVKQGYEVGTQPTWRCERWLLKYRGRWLCSIDCLRRLLRIVKKEAKQKERIRHANED